MKVSNSWQWLVPKLTGFYRVLPGFTGFYWLLLGLMSLYLVTDGSDAFAGEEADVEAALAAPPHALVGRRHVDHRDHVAHLAHQCKRNKQTNREPISFRAQKKETFRPSSRYGRPTKRQKPVRCHQSQKKKRNKRKKKSLRRASSHSVSNHAAAA